MIERILKQLYLTPAVTLLLLGASALAGSSGIAMDIHAGWSPAHEADVEAKGGGVMVPTCKGESKPPRRQRPPQTEYWNVPLVEREDGLMVWRAANGDEYINVGVFGEQLSTVRQGVPMTKRQQASLAWLEANAQALDQATDGALVWRSNYATNYDTLLFEPPWSGGYGQASIISGYIALHEAQPERGWLSTAIRAGLAYGVATTEGGFSELLPNSCIWFEELTSPSIAKAGLSPHICNGHIYATLHLTRLARVSGDERIRKLAVEGERSLKLMMSMFDNGTWIRYDLSPRTWDLRFCLKYVSDEEGSSGSGVVGSAVPGPVVCSVELSQCNSTDEPVRLCVGVDGDDQGAWRIGDGSYGADFGVVPWGAPVNRDGVLGRPIRPGKTVFVMELPPGAETNYFREPYLQLRIHYLDVGTSGSLDALVFSMREQVNNEYAELPGSPHRLRGDGTLKVLEKSVRLSDLGKSSLTAWKISNAYVRPLGEMERLTGDPFYTHWRLRLEAQVRGLIEQYPSLEFGKR